MAYHTSTSYNLLQMAYHTSTSYNLL